MFKKALSLLLALMLVVASFSVAMISVAATGDGAALSITVTSNLFPTHTASFTQQELDDMNGTVTVTYGIESKDWRMVNADWLLTYDGTVLQYDEAANTNVMPVAPDATVNTNPTSVEYGIKGNCTSLQTYYLDAEEGGEVAFVTVTFKAVGTGDTTVDLQVRDMLVTKLDDGQTLSENANEEQLVTNGEVNDEIVGDFALSAGIEGPEVEPEITTEPVATEPEDTTVPATEPATEPAEDAVCIVAGAPADIFGTAWDGTNEANTMTKGEDGKYTKEYTVDKAFDDVQLKTVKNGAEWIGDKTGNNVTFNLTGAGTFTVVYDPEENYTYVQGDIVQEITEFKYDTVFAVGNGEGAWLNGSAWDPAYAANEMTKVADDVWEIEFESVPDGFERQIKFAIDGAWTHNFGGAFVESGVETDAVYNGDNITFDTEETCTVKAQLDLRNFDFATKEGAKFTVTITEEGEEPTTEPATEPVEAKGFTLVATSNLFPEKANYYDDLDTYQDENGDVFVTVDYDMCAPGKYLINIDVDELTWDPEVLEFKEAYNTMGTGRSAKFTIFPFAYEQGLGAGMVNTFGDNNGGRIVGNYTSVQPAAYASNEDGSAVTVVRAVFKVLKKDPGTVTTVNLKLDTLSLDDETATEPSSKYSLVSRGVVNDDVFGMASYNTDMTPDGEEVPIPTEAPTTEPAATTEPAETTEPAAPSTPVGATLKVEAASNYCNIPEGQVVTVGNEVSVTFKAPEAQNILALQWGMNYDKEKLELTGISTIAPAQMLINTNAESYNVLGSFSDIENPVAVAAGDDVATFVFTTKAEGETVVDFRVVDMTVRNETADETIFANEIDQRQPVVEPTTESPEDTTAPATEEPATEAPTEEPTGEPATEATTPAEDTYAVEGKPEDIFGGEGADNTMVKGEDGKYTKSYTVDKAYTDASVVAVKNGTEKFGDKDGKEILFDLTGPGTFVVTFDPETKLTTVSGDIVKLKENPSDATSATGTTGKSSGGSSSSGSSSYSGGTNGAVQTGNASMAIIILLVLVSATAGIYFARRKVK